MARADLLCELIKNGLVGDERNFRKTVEAVCAEERGKQHTILARRIEDLLKNYSHQSQRRESSPQALSSNGNNSSLFHEIVPEKTLEQLVLPSSAIQLCGELIEEQMRADLLRSYGLEPRNRLLFIGPPGNGKTSLAEAVAESLMVPLYVVRYESIIGAYLGETASRLAKLFEYVKTRQCVLFFDEFETLGKERGDRHETGEIKRVVSSLLLQIDALPSYVVVIAATNHETLLDKATWRRFQIRIELGKPSRRNLEAWFSSFEKKTGFSFGLEASTLAKKLMGLSYAEVEEFALAVYRRFVLLQPDGDAKSITRSQLTLYRQQPAGNVDVMEVGVDV